MSDTPKSVPGIKASLSGSIVSWVKSLLKVDVEYSDKPEGKMLLTIDIPIITGYVNIKVSLATLTLLQGYIKL